MWWMPSTSSLILLLIEVLISSKNYGSVLVTPIYEENRRMDRWFRFQLRVDSYRFSALHFNRNCVKREYFRTLKAETQLSNDELVLDIKDFLEHPLAPSRTKASTEDPSQPKQNPILCEITLDADALRRRKRVTITVEVDVQFLPLSIFWNWPG
ncbi:hypothetical protein GGR55DRAFT_649627 [Xylaria sp. FL0064]|nr:hypothetical protein GGR55DRAFT_649627 [Xylaria sp. FL0064]